MAKATLTIASKNYGSWSLRGWLLCKMAGLEFEEQPVGSDDPSTRAELLLLSPSFLVPCLTHDGIKVWDTLAIAEYLNETLPEAGLLPKDRAARAHCRSISRRDAFRLLQHALGAADEPEGAPPRLQGLGRRAGRHRPHRLHLARMPRRRTAACSCSATSRGMADAMFAPVVTRFLTYDVKLESDCAGYCKAVMALPQMQEWIEGAKAEPDEVVELDVEF